MRVAIALDPGNEDSDDLTFDAPVKGENYTIKCGHTKEMEVPETETDDYLRPKQSRAGKESGLERVCVVWSHVPEEITLDKRATKSFYKFIMTVDRDLLVAEQEMRNGKLLVGIRRRRAQVAAICKTLDHHLIHLGSAPVSFGGWGLK